MLTKTNIAFLMFTILLVGGSVQLGLAIKENRIENEKKTVVERIGNINGPNAGAEIFELKRSDYTCVFLVQNQTFTTFQCLR